MIRLIILCACFIMMSTALQAQERNWLNLDMQQKIAPSFQVNNETYSGATAREIRVSVRELDGGPFELGFYLSGAYTASIDYGYGINFAYQVLQKKAHRLKAGLGAGRIKMGSFLDGTSVGDIREDEYHETFKPFLEWNWDFSGYVSLFAQAGYQFLRSETETVTEILERDEWGDPRRIHVMDDRRFYGSGWVMGAGLRLNLY